jgi:hypothetical protein
MLYPYAKLSENQLSKIRLFEAETGKRVLALQRVEVNLAELTAEELHKLEELEHEVGFILIAIEGSQAVDHAEGRAVSGGSSAPPLSERQPTNEESPRDRALSGGAAAASTAHRHPPPRPRRTITPSPR